MKERKTGANTAGDAAPSATAVSVQAAALSSFIENLFIKLGAAPAHARVLADSLVSAELDGVASHGVMLLPMYIERVQAGSVSLTAQPRVVQDLGALVVMTAQHALGQVSSQAAVELAIARAHQHGVAMVAVREAFHFGAGAYWARQMAAQGMVGMVFSNTRPLMPAPGGAQALVGNNPLCLAFPGAVGEPLVVDMATSASAMGKIRLAAAKGAPIPAGWATDAAGNDTTSAAEAIKGILLPAAGPKGFGLAAAIDLLCGAISGGGMMEAVTLLYGNAAQPYNCAHNFIAVDAVRLHDGQGIGAQVDEMSEAIRQSPKAPGVERIYAPGDVERRHRQDSKGRCVLSGDLLHELNDIARQLESPLLDVI